MVPYFEMYFFWVWDNVFAIGELIEAKSPQPVLITGATAATRASISGGATAPGFAIGVGGATGAACFGGGTAGAGGATSTTGAIGSSVGAGAAGEGATKFANAATSSASSTVTMMGVPTA